ncbi:hypothetical protein [Acinetobacter sp. Ac_5812]|uniref:hypothetical protein n=1 Tax=Acinetobacter sp. Ac_5812 TaxID=1848937 RepID=UPI0014906CC2|nr:hypothetical protein [Acinetobacter sp. Ac_5812]NNP70390.1 hypothetical protein [Acinetobacter sp. Ac_5812]
MTQAQDKIQTTNDDAKVTETKKRGPKPKQQAEVQTESNPAPNADNVKLGAENNSGVSSSSQTELASSEQPVTGAGLNDPNPEFQVSLDAVKTDGEDQGNSNSNQDNNGNSEKASSSENTTDLKNVNPEEKQISNGDSESKDEQNVNNENIVVQKVDQTLTIPKSALTIKVKNNGYKAVYEPFSKVSIEPGENETVIECANRTDLKTVLINIDQLKTLGKKVEVLENE